MKSRAAVEFVTSRSYDQARTYLLEHDASNLEAVLDKIGLFEEQYHASATDQDIPGGFAFKVIDNVSGRYRLCQIKATRDYRAEVMFPHGGSEAIWIHLFRKKGRKNKEDIRTAQKRAEETWIARREDKNE